MLVNEDLFKKENLEVPKTLQELLDVCQKFKAAGQYMRPLYELIEKLVDEAVKAYRN